MILCVILDYIQVIMLILCKLYMTNSFYFYKFITSTYPFGIGAIICIVYGAMYCEGPRKILMISLLKTY